MTTGRKPRLKSVKVVDGKLVRVRRFVAGQDRKVLEAKAKKLEAAWLAKSKTR
jgi:hypothetical protein